MHDSNFTFEDYDENDFEHKCVLMQLENDQDVKDAFYSIQSYVVNIQENVDKTLIDHVCVARIHTLYVGMIMSKKYGDKVEVSYALLPKYRGEGIAAFMLESYCNILFKTYDLDKIYLQIRQDNIASRIVASRVGFSKDKGTRYVMNNSIQNH